MPAEDGTGERLNFAIICLSRGKNRCESRCGTLEALVSPDNDMPSGSTQQEPGMPRHAEHGVRSNSDLEDQLHRLLLLELVVMRLLERLAREAA